ncbi:MAG: hypothetical protein WAL64_10950 [Candidatus Dormiibacterota bacterium]
MPPLPDVPNVLRVDWQWSVGSDTTITTKNFFSYSGSAPTSASCVTMAADIYALQAVDDSQWGSDVTLIGCKVTDLSSHSGGVGEHAQSTVGGRSGIPLPASACVLVNYQIARRYRGGKPRSYFPWFTSEDIVTAQTWDSSVITAVDSALSAFFAGVAGISVGGCTITQHVNVSYYNGFTARENMGTGRWKNVPNLRATPLVDPILSFAASLRIANQRRRTGR